MSEQIWWYVARSTGIVAFLLAAGGVIWGLLLSSGYLERNPSKKWLLSLHSWLGGLAVIFTGAHVVALGLDSFIQYSIADLLVPFAADKAPGRWPIAWGVISGYLLVLVQATSLMMKRMPRRWWRAIHMTSYGVFVSGMIHGLMAGTDSGNPLYLIVTGATALLTVFLTTFRVLARRRKKKTSTPALEPA